MKRKGRRRGEWDGSRGPGARAASHAQESGEVSSAGRREAWSDLHERREAGGGSWGGRGIFAVLAGLYSPHLLATFTHHVLSTLPFRTVVDPPLPPAPLLLFFSPQTRATTMTARRRRPRRRPPPPPPPRRPPPRTTAMMTRRTAMTVGAGSGGRGREGRYRRQIGGGSSGEGVPCQDCRADGWHDGQLPRCHPNHP